MTLKELGKLYYNWKLDNSSMPYPIKETFRDTSEKALVKCIKAYCKMMDWEASSYDARGYQNNEGKWMMSKLDKGRGDLLVNMKGAPAIPCWIEIKIGKDYQKPHQKKFEQDCLRRGVHYVIVKDWDDWFGWVVSNKKNG